MKKWTVLVFIALLGLILGLRYLSKKNEAKVEQNAGMQLSEPVGVALPQGVNTYSPSGSVASSPADSSALDAAASKGACEGGALNDILSSHGVSWGYSTKGVVFEPSETEKIYEALENYFSCEAVAMDDMAACGPLTTDSGDKGDVRFSNPRYKCSDSANRVLFKAYMAGMHGNASACASFLAGDSVKDIKLDTVEFCNIAAKGMENICVGLAPFLPASKKAECLTVFPAKKTDCSGKEFCLDNYKIYSAIKARNPGQCPEKYRPACEAFFSKRQASCSNLITKASKLYCSSLAVLKKKQASGMFLSEQEKKDAEIRKKEEERIMQEVNKNARKMLGKE
ncbi:MAG TPA: hypothetical protein DCL44_04870 [Elusimicrobia bacterium]|nr:hypothetical protein [Elusimicrobiota bacterium]